jgi:hypothetical protein
VPVVSGIDLVLSSPLAATHAAHAVLDAAVADLPATTLELQALRTVLQDLVPRDSPLLASEASLEEAAAALTTVLQERHQQQRQQQRRRGDAAAAGADAATQHSTSAVTRVLVACEQPGALIHIMAYLPSQEWLYVAPVSRPVRAAYMLAVHQPLWRRSEDHLFHTSTAAAVESEARLDEALTAGIDSVWS